MRRRSPTVEEAAMLGLLALEQDRERTAPLLSQLRSGARHWKDLTGREQRSLLSSGPLVDYLLEKSFNLRSEDPPRMVSLARAACALADSLKTRRYGRRVLADLRARAWAELANAYRLIDEFDEAERAFARASRLVNEGTHSTGLRARVSELVASYLNDRRFFSEAIGYLEESKKLYASCTDVLGFERCLLLLGHVLTLANEPERAALTYWHVLHRIVPGSPHLFHAVNGIAFNLVECGQPKAAKVLLRRYRYVRLYKRAGKINEYRRFWLEGKIATGLHDYGKAEAKLNTARLALLHVKQAYLAALVTLDLTWLYARQGRRNQVIWLVDDMLRTFRALGIARESIASLLLLRKSCEQQRPIEALCGQIEGLIKLLPELTARKGRKAKGD
jgi:tetratricopeptide (TPR) repeat protein